MTKHDGTLERIFKKEATPSVCNLQKHLVENGLPLEEKEAFALFLEEYGHDMCDALAFWLHDHYDLKIGAIRAIDQNDEDDLDYETVVHQFVYLDDNLILDARGIDTERAMLDYYKESSVFDDEEWDFMIDENYQHDPKRRQYRVYDEHEEKFAHFLKLLDNKLSPLITRELVHKQSKRSPLFSLAPESLGNNLGESGVVTDGQGVFYCQGESYARLALRMLCDIDIEQLDETPITTCREQVAVSYEPKNQRLIVHDLLSSGNALSQLLSREMVKVEGAFIPEAQCGDKDDRYLVASDNVLKAELAHQKNNRDVVMSLPRGSSGHVDNLYEKNNDKEKGVENSLPYPKKRL